MSPVPPLDAVRLDEVEAAVRRALVTATADGLRVLGYGEITLVVGWPPDEPVWACKRLPVFTSADAVERYRTQFERYLQVLRDRGVEPVPSAFSSIRAASAHGAPEHVGYVVQPALPASSLAVEVLRGADPARGTDLFQRVVGAVGGVVDERTGLDGQISNWALVDDRLCYLDVTTPMLFDGDGHIELDVDLFLAAYPWLLRGLLRRAVVPGVVGAYREPRHVLVDLAANLLKERLDEWLSTVLAAANEVVTPAITEQEVRHYYRSDARLWEMMLRLRRADRWWQRSVRRRSYPFLLPGPIQR
jgi:hypothetical protein